jgi:hypothetical protein
MAGDLAGDITRHFDGIADTASLNACQSLATGVFSQPVGKSEHSKCQYFFGAFDSRFIKIKIR